MVLSLQDAFTWGRLLGKGAFSEVVYVEEKATGKPFAMKIINKTAIKSKKDLTHLLEEIALQKKLAHPNIVQLYQVYESEKKVYLQMEYCSGGELFSRIVEKGFLTEGEATAIIRAVLEAVQYLHSLSICHRDLKPENILLLHADSGALDGPDNLFKAVRISDFGFSKFMSPGTLLQTQLGSLAYTAPEILKGQPYDTAVDIYSIGVLAYVLLSGSFPWGNVGDRAMFDSIVKGNFSLTGDQWSSVSIQAKDFVSSLMQVDPAKRPTASQALEHDWFSTIRKEMETIDKVADQNRFPTLPPQALQKARKVANDLKLAIDVQNNLRVSSVMPDQFDQALTYVFSYLGQFPSNDFHFRSNQTTLFERFSDALQNPQPQTDALLQGLAGHFSFLTDVQTASLGLRKVTPEPTEPDDAGEGAMEIEADLPGGNGFGEGKSL